MTQEKATDSMSALAKWVSDSVRAAGWAPATVFFVHVAVSRGLGWYRSAPGLDIPMHFAGGVAIAYFFARSVSIASAERLIGTLKPLGLSIVVLSLVCAATVLWEFAEWTTDWLGWTRAQGGLDDTMSDMLLGIVGGAVFLLVYRRQSSSLGTNS